MLVALTGGTGGAKLVQGLSLEVNPEELLVVCNTADDFVLHGLYISPDVDTITYTLAGVGDAGKGWGVKDDTFAALEWLGRYGGETWFRMGDRDLATHITRSRLLQQGWTLSQATEHIRKSLGVPAAIRPMTDDRVETRIVTPKGEIPFQEFFVKNRWSDEVRGVFFAGIESCRPAPGVVEAIEQASAVILCPSNPVTSLGPILGVPGIKEILQGTRAPVLAVSPIIGKAPVSGPAGKLMAAVELEVSSFGVARAYSEFLDVILIGSQDAGAKERIEGLGIKSRMTSIRMDSLEDKRRLAREVLALI